LTRFDEGGGQASDIDLIGELAANMLGRTFCALGDAAAMPTGGFIAKFRDEFEAKLRQSSSKPQLELVNI
jgi:NADH-quinone oxidoreductase subunit F